MNASRRRNGITIAVAFLVQGIGLSIQYATGVLLQTFKHVLQASSATILLCTSGALMIGMAVISPILGRLFTQLKLRTTLSAGLLATAAGYLLLPAATTLWHLTFVYALLFACGALTGSLGSSQLIANWFQVKRGAAMGISATGIFAIGAIVSVSALQLMTTQGFEQTCTYLGGAILALSPLTWMLVNDFPEEQNRKDTKPPSTFPDSQPMAPSRRPLQNLISDRLFWTITICAAICGATGGGLLANLIPMAQAIGMPGQRVSFLIPSYSSGATAGMLFFGASSNYLSQRSIVQIVTALLIFALASLSFSLNYSVWIFASLVLGFGVAGAQLVPRILVAENFGAENFSAVLGFMSPIILTAYACYLWSFGFAVDLSGTYQLGIRGAVLSLLGIAALSTALPRTKCR